MNNEQPHDNEYLEIITLGKFQVKRGDENYPMTLTARHGFGNYLNTFWLTDKEE